MLFAPPESEIYPPGFATSVHVKGLSEILEGAERGASHFAGVCTVVTKLLNIVAPDVAYFGQKDAQQVAVVRRMVADLDIPVRIEALPDRPRARRPRALQPQPAARSAPTAPARSRSTTRSGAAEEAVAAGERDAARDQDASPQPTWGVSTPSTWRSSTPTASMSSPRSTAARSSPWRRRSARSA